MSKHDIFHKSNLIVFSIILGSLLISFGGISSVQALDDVAPTAQTLSATNIAESSAILNGSVNPNGWLTGYYFEYGTTATLGNSTAFQSAGSNQSYANVAQGASGLSSNTAYFYRIVAQSQFGTSWGNILSFVTRNDQLFGKAPSVETRPVSFVAENTAIINAGINPNGSTTTVWFDFGTTSNLSLKTNTQTVGDSFLVQDFRGTLSKLSPGTIYFYRITAQNQLSTQSGTTLSFKTLGVTPTTTPTPLPTITPTPNIEASPAPTATLVGETNDEDNEVDSLIGDISNALGDSGWWWLLFITLAAILVFLIYLLVSERKRQAEYRRRMESHISPPPPPYYRQ